MRLPPRWLCFVPPPTAVIYSDAAAEEARLTIGWVVFLPSGEKVAGAAVIPPSWMCAFESRETQVHIGKLWQRYQHSTRAVRSSVD